MHRLADFDQLFDANKAVHIGNFLKAGDFYPLTMLKGPYKLAGLKQTVMGSGVQPRITAPKAHHVEFTLLHIDAVQVRDFVLAARRRF